jgi:hypothetical protein
MLKLLQNQLKQSKIEKIYDFTVKEWNTNKSLILKNISKKFSNDIIIRSSAKGEDSLEKSQAGNYLSILNVNPKSKIKLTKSIKLVINSYSKKGNSNDQNLILIQTQTKNIKISGVVFTKTPDNGSPYYVINYETSGATDGVTKGTTNKIIKIFRNTNIKNLSENWKLLLKSIKEIEKLLNYTFLDIEFAITKSNKIIIFQVRPLTTINQKNITLDSKIDKLIKHSQKQFDKKNTQKILLGKKTIFSDMADWNPAEIIGNNPNLLDYSLYDFLIMKQAWHKGREIIGYQKTNHNLMLKFGNKPYVDIRASFNSLIPDNINKILKNKLINFYLQKLQAYPHLHDKVEFEILFSCYEPFLKSRLDELKNHNFSNVEIKILKNKLLEFTNNLIKSFNNISTECTNSICLLQNNRIQILSKLNKSKRSYKDLLYASEALLNDCKSLGTIPFSTMARIAFISSTILKNLIKNDCLSKKIAETFMNSISSPLSQFQEDQIKYMKKQISQKQFLQKYGHLRPGTYDITAIRYDKDIKFLQDVEYTNLKLSKNKSPRLPSIDKILRKSGLIFLEINFYDFLEKSIIQREELKFEFTKNLSDALELIAEAGEKLNFSRKEIANLDLKSIFLKPKILNRDSLVTNWRKKIINQKSNKIISNHLVLPPIIMSKNDFNVISYPSAKPNFVTSKKISSKIIHVDNIDNILELENKIVLLENADPGYDWIFSHNLSGLITKYGGVASHMAIRCAELGLPAAIGCGELLYSDLEKASKILLDCENTQIIILQQTKSEKYVEEKRVLKSLGYIK